MLTNENSSGFELSEELPELDDLARQLDSFALAAFNRILMTRERTLQEAVALSMDELPIVQEALGMLLAEGRRRIKALDPEAASGPYGDEMRASVAEVEALRDRLAGATPAASPKTAP